MDESPLYGSDPETAIAVPEESIRIEIAVREQSVRIDRASNGIRFEVVTDELQESCAVHSNQQPSIVGLTQTNELRRCWILPGRTVLHSPKPGLCCGPEIARAVLIQRPNGPAEGAIFAVALRAAACYRAEAAGIRKRAGPHRSLTILEQRCHKVVTKLRARGQLAATPGCKAHSRANPKGAVSRDEQAVDGVVGKMLTRRWLPGATANAIEAKQAEFCAEPEIPIGRLGHRVDVALEGPILDGPHGMCVLTDVKRWV